MKEVPEVLCSDGESTLKLLRNLDVSRKSRHLEIRIEWIKNFFLLHAAKVRSSCEEDPGQTALSQHIIIRTWT